MCVSVCVCVCVSVCVCIAPSTSLLDLSDERFIVLTGLHACASTWVLLHFDSLLLLPGVFAESVRKHHSKRQSQRRKHSKQAIARYIESSAAFVSSGDEPHLDGDTSSRRVDERGGTEMARREEGAGSHVEGRRQHDTPNVSAAGALQMQTDAQTDEQAGVVELTSGADELVAQAQDMSTSLASVEQDISGGITTILTQAPIFEKESSV